MPDLLWRSQVWLGLLCAGVAAAVASFVPAFGFRMSGSIGGGESQRVFTYEEPIRLVPDSFPIGWAYLFGCAALATVALVALKRGPQPWMLLLVTALCAAGVAHLAATSASQLSQPVPWPRTSGHGSCSFDKAPGDVELASPFRLECGEAVLGSAGRDVATKLAREHAELDSLQGFVLKPRIGVWILQPLMLLGLLLFCYLSLRLVMRPAFAIGAMIGVAAVIELIFLLHGLSQLR